MWFRYRSGEEVRGSDQILYASEPGTVEFVTAQDNSEHAWHIEQYGGGCMLSVAPFGSLFLSDPQDDEDLDFVARART